MWHTCKLRNRDIYHLAIIWDTKHHGFDSRKLISGLPWPYTLGKSWKTSSATESMRCFWIRSTSLATKPLRSKTTAEVSGDHAWSLHCEEKARTAQGWKKLSLGVFRMAVTCKTLVFIRKITGFWMVFSQPRSGLVISYATSS